MGAAEGAAAAAPAEPVLGSAERIDIVLDWWRSAIGLRCWHWQLDVRLMFPQMSPLCGCFCPTFNRLMNAQT